MKFTAKGTEEMKLLDCIEPLMSDGHYRARAVQTVAVGEGKSQSYAKDLDFYVAGRAFTLPGDDLFSVSPQENAQGNFENELPFVVLKQKSFPWQYHMGGTPPGPWVALIAVAEGEGAAEKDITVGELLASREEGVFFPAQNQPREFVEEPEEVCHVVDLPRALYESIMPSPQETPYLCHGKYVNLARTEENVSGMDGYFSVVMGNRFVPSGEEQDVKTTMHLVSLLGYQGADLSGCRVVRLCSLYHWSVFSQRSREAGFGELIRGLDCREFGREGAENPLLKQGVTVKEHRLRTGETTGSLYASPFLPAGAPALPMSFRHTADGYLIYDRNRGIFDVRYACAWQLGRMAVLGDEGAALQILRWRRGLVKKAYTRLLTDNMEENIPDFAALSKRIREALEGRREAETGTEINKEKRP